MEEFRQKTEIMIEKLQMKIQRRARIQGKRKFPENSRQETDDREELFQKRISKSYILIWIWNG